MKQEIIKPSPIKLKLDISLGQVDIAAVNVELVDLKLEDDPAVLIAWGELRSRLRPYNMDTALDVLSGMTPEDIGLTRATTDRQPDIQTEHSLVQVLQPYVGANGNLYNPLPKYMPEPVYEAHSRMNAAYMNYLAAQEAPSHRPGLIAVSGYRSPAYQAIILLQAIHREGLNNALNSIYLPGFSEHNDPEHTAVDYTAVGDINGIVDINDSRGIQIFEDYQEFDWLLKNGADYGFALTYYPDPNNPGSGLTKEGFLYEPWHWRYLGVKAAQAFMRNNNVADILELRRKSLG